MFISFFLFNKFIIISIIKITAKIQWTLMVDEYDTAWIFDNILFAAKMEIHSNDLCYCYHAPGRHSERFYLYFNKARKFAFIYQSCTGTYNAFLQLLTRNNINGIHNPAANALATMKKVNFTRYLILSLKTHSITKTNSSTMPVVK